MTSERETRSPPRRRLDHGCGGPYSDAHLRARVAELERAIRLVQDMHVPEISGYEAHCHICSPQDGSWPCLVRMELDAVLLPPEEEQG